LVAVHTFLRLNGVTLNVSNKEIEDYTVAIATDKDLTWEAISSWLEVHSK